MAHILQQIVEQKLRELEQRKILRPQAELERACRSLAPTRDFEAALRAPRGQVRLIAEIKQASPSRGVFTGSFDPGALARTYATHGAAAISVLTDEKFFKGSLAHLAAVRRLVDVPLLRKDFTIDEYQLWEARAAGADAVLLIVSILDAARLRGFLNAAKALGLAALVEVHTRDELDTALAAGAPVIGINNRDLQTFEMTIDTTLGLLPHVPPGPVVVSESGFFTAADVRRVVEAGAHAVLVGEALVRAEDVGAKVRELALVEGVESPTVGRDGSASRRREARRADES
jgi:indole-3-glycerol phosphate synthase